MDPRAPSFDHHAKLSSFAHQQLSPLEETIHMLKYQKLNHCIMQFQGFDWLSGNGIRAINDYTMPEK